MEKLFGHFFLFLEAFLFLNRNSKTVCTMVIYSVAVVVCKLIEGLFFVFYEVNILLGSAEIFGSRLVSTLYLFRVLYFNFIYSLIILNLILDC